MYVAERRRFVEERFYLLQRLERRALPFFAKGNEVSPRTLRPRIELIESPLQADIFRYACLLCSIPVSPGYGRLYSAQGAKSGQFAYYICGTLFRKGARTCSARSLNARKVEDFIVEKIRERILTEETIVELVQLVAEETDAMAGALANRLGRSSRRS